jgi:hypothetical protein
MRRSECRLVALAGPHQIGNEWAAFTIIVGFK